MYFSYFFLDNYHQKFNKNTTTAISPSAYRIRIFRILQFNIYRTSFFINPQVAAIDDWVLYIHVIWLRKANINIYVIYYIKVMLFFFFFLYSFNFHLSFLLFIYLLNLLCYVVSFFSSFLFFFLYLILISI